MDLGPHALQKNTQAARTDDGAVSRRIFHGVRGLRRKRHKGTHQRCAQNRKNRPAEHRQHHAGPGGPIGLFRFTVSVMPGHQRIDADACAHRDGRNDQLDGENDGEGGQTVSGIPSHEKTVHDIIKRLDQLRQHHRRRDLQKNLPDAFCIKEIALMLHMHL